MTNDFLFNMAIPQTLRLDDEQLSAFYQPIIALDTREVMGYEVLGRACKGEAVRSLGPFFCDPEVPDQDHIAVDRLLREQAFRKIAATKQPPMLFINLKPNWMHRGMLSGEQYTLSLLDKYRIDPSTVVIEVTEESFGGGMEALLEAIAGYRSKGCLIAIDDVGSGFSGMDRIAQIQPNILKIDIHMLKASASHDGFLATLRSFSALADQLGASLLAEGVETREDLQRAIQAGVRYVQGYLFAQAGPEFDVPDRYSSLLDEELEAHRQLKLYAENYWRYLSDRLTGKIDRVGHLEELEEEEQEWIARLLPVLENNCTRVYLCRDDGIQISSNYSRRVDGSWRREEEYSGANWSWRPYFVPNAVQLSDSRRSIVSRAYTDLDSRAWIRTLSILVKPGIILLVDMKDPELDDCRG
ncbi:EAL domain-containing protein [Paenibacillus glycanilyticus]|uniref:EAL-domain containing protein YkuI n=1 Tax=Paenibacillus glycanilyticus TaxID=126569 RepID=A0ABQ6GQQ8_9BACL|nr:EAL domain-containing protein [Paenibacillus glycanilyticus]GLX71362.1 putative EAL-domain containing protein YkuI [Paenibacillus glycanilyticus]